MQDRMMAAVLYGVGDVRLEQRPVPVPGAGEVLVRVHRVGVCGSDVHYFRDGRIGHYVVQAPMVLGHESAGEVVALGSDVTTLKIGDRVALEPGYTCGTCRYCKSGRYNLCPDVVFMATPPVDGALAQYVAWPATHCFPLPESMTMDDGAMMEPLAVGLWAVERGRVRPGDVVAVFGCGPIGLLTLQAARTAGAARLIAVDIAPARLAHARRLGATDVVDDRSGDATEQIRQLLAGSGDAWSSMGVDVALETAGSVRTTRNTLQVTRPGGVAVLTGLPAQPMVELDIVSAASKEIDIRGQFRYANRYPPAIALAGSGRIDVRSLVTHHFDLMHAQEALEFADARKDVAIKVMIDLV
ncbi:MAG: NAD(P)-dependent alcohol dehydrogenase [Anaerolineae bacterium]|nr:NAD(P)-dependent alcohol dehydrogenase [Chloroflexota bacterium]